MPVKRMRQLNSGVASALSLSGYRRHGVTATPIGPVPTVMSVGSLVLLFTSIVDTVPL